MEPRSPRPAAAHPSHDQLLIARLAADDVNDTERSIARRLVAECQGCATLLADISAISAATRHELPMPRRTRDFRITAEQAAALRRRPGFFTWLRGALTPGGTLVQPLAGAALSIGLALVVVGAVLPAPTQRLVEQSSGSASQPTAASPASDASARNVLGAPASPEATTGFGSRRSANGQPAAASPAATALPAPASAQLLPAAASVAPDSTQVPGTQSPSSYAPAESTAGATEGRYESSPPAVPLASTPGNEVGEPSPEASPGAKSTSPEPGATPTGDAFDQAGSTPTTAAAAGPGATPAPTRGDDDRPAGLASDDRRPLLILAGFLLLLSGALLLGMRRVTRRA